METRSVWQIIADTLNSEGIDVFPPGTHKGECKSPYVVIKKDGTMQVADYSSEYVFFKIMLYVPQNKYNELDELETKVREILFNKLRDLVKPYGSNDPDYFDDNYNAHLRQIFYRNVRRNKHF